MHSSRLIALIGLSSTEQVLLEGVLFPRNGGRILNAVRTHDLHKAELIIANADHVESVHTLRSLAPPARVILLGTSNAGTGWPVLARPLQVHAVLAAARRALLNRPADQGAQTKGATRLRPAAQEAEDVGVPSVTPPGWAEDSLGETSTQLPDADRILVIGQPGPATGNLLSVLKSAGYAVDFAADSEAALRQVARHRYGFAFLIELSFGSGVVALCQRLRTASSAWPSALRIAVIADHHRPWPRLRSWLAGCRAWMTIPLHRQDLLTYLAQPSGASSQP